MRLCFEIILEMMNIGRIFEPNHHSLNIAKFDSRYGKYEMCFMWY